MRFGKNNLLCSKYIDVYEFWGGTGDLHFLPFIFCLLFQKMEKLQEHDLYLNQILDHFDLNSFY